MTTGPADRTRRTDLPDRPALRPEVLRERLLAPAGPLRRLDVVARSGSTNADLARGVGHDPDAWPAPALLVTEHQGAGRGRLGRTWTTPPRAALLRSRLLRADVPRAALSWVPLLAGLATATTLRDVAGLDAAVKWPNDVLVPDGDEPRKVAGILAEVLPDGGVVLGVGLNVTQTRAELPVPTATSLALAGARTTDREELLVALEVGLADVLDRWERAGGDAFAAGLADECAAACATLGSRVRVELTGGGEVHGLATALAPDGGLDLALDDGTTRVVRSGDVHHLRPGAPGAPGARS